MLDNTSLGLCTSGLHQLLHLFVTAVMASLSVALQH